MSKRADAARRFRSRDSRWRTKFGRWVADVGPSVIVDALRPDPDLRVTVGCVYGWVRGTAPRPERARALVELSRGRLTLEDVYRHAAHMREVHEDTEEP